MFPDFISYELLLDLLITRSPQRYKTAEDLGYYRDLIRELGKLDVRVKSEYRWGRYYR